MQDLPKDPDLLAVVAEFLRREVMPAVSNGLAFRVRVAANVVDMVQRQLTQPESIAEEEQQRLRDLLGEDGDTRLLTERLCEGIANGEFTLDTPGLADFLWFVTLHKVAVDQPRYSGYLNALDS
ncbi:MULTISPECIES: DUF6285 domain-containing protein [Alloalcanivorax]|jgi:uncharacterized protein DUF6285|uniref:DUF6285 domain-containing protein n=2 Tax=Alloalcanivorax TaxID=3020832 RepID=K0CJ92_ALCDB|nr:MULTISPECIES: DUF6285 domain-containing protein [Alloalcanivorax]AFT72480.1 hypothetical protein B5T_04220 [Alloalcanivorax dieselolei B5]ARB47493.1 hypothetical protein P40_20535 [Alloalcanivorax xenomutans]MCE7508044.1 DUF6285 domain-containing protein [Alloalcanivorax xenomutans]MCE7523299.1 DUF6285 domain-containing protein [Alloalcanivorax xenomutans]GGJ78215.1 hypothetical protein GCM10007426_04050 [Alloalcanivorax dieselolei]